MSDSHPRTQPPLPSCSILSATPLFGRALQTAYPDSQRFSLDQRPRIHLLLPNVHSCPSSSVDGCGLGYFPDYVLVVSVGYIWHPDVVVGEMKHHSKQLVGVLTPLEQYPSPSFCLVHGPFLIQHHHREFQNFHDPLSPSSPSPSSPSPPSPPPLPIALVGLIVSDLGWLCWIRQQRILPILPLEIAHCSKLAILGQLGEFGPA